MTPGDDRNPDYEGDDQLAAEYVIGVLSADERRTAAQRIETDLDFARLVDVWQQRLSPLNAGYDEVQPPASLKTALDAWLFDHGRPAMPASCKAFPSGAVLPPPLWPPFS